MCLITLNPFADSMEYVKIEQANADRAKRIIVDLNLLDSSRAVQHSRSYVYFPILDIGSTKAKKLLDKLGADIVVRKGAKTGAKPTYKESLGKILAKEEIPKLAKGYDQLGDIAIIEFDGPAGKERQVAELLMRTNGSIKTVLAKVGAVTGRLRIRKLRYVAGKRNYIAIYRENNCAFRFDVRKVFFSNRLSYERSRILKLVRNGESVVVMFAGVGPFAIEIAKSNRSTNVVAIELNRFGYKYMLDNVKLNKTQNVTPVLGDVKKLSAKYKNFADRIIMPLPKSSMEFLDDAYRVAKSSAIVHLYVFTKADETDSVYRQIKEHSKRMGYRATFLNERVVRPYSATEIELGIDYRIAK